MRSSALIVKVLATLALLTGAAAAQDKVRIGLPVPKATAYIGVQVAVDRGFFKEANIDPEVTVFRGGAAAQEALSAGAADVISYPPGGVALVQLKGGQKEKVVGVIDERPLGWLMLVKPESKIKTAKDLQGVKLGITVKGGLTDMLAIWLTKNAGVTAQIIPVGGAAINQAMLDGQVDAIVATPAGSWQMVESGKARSIFDFGKEMKPVIADSWVASEEMITKRPELLRKTIGAIYKGQRYIQDNRDWGLKYLKDFTEEKDDKINQLTYERLILLLNKDGTMERTWIEDGLKMAADAWNNPDIAKYDPNNVYTNEFLK
jgi:ABC-type nitrate/sulfonate/bicarbonate transport system substrate-binding protein